MTHSFSETDEIPVATDAELLSTGPYDQCSFESYCETLAAIINEFPTDWSIEPDPWCNLSPGGDSQSPGPWRCVGSADDACGYAYLEANLPDTTDVCPRTEYGGKDVCVIASSEAEASGKCEDVCDKSDAEMEAGWGPVVYPDPGGQLNCTVFGPNTMLWTSDVFANCANPLHEIDTTIALPFSFSADLQINGGANASVSDDENIGSIAYRVENCVGQACDIVIEGLELSYMMHTGTYYDDEANPYPFSVDGVSISLLEPVHGTITPQITTPPRVAFPSKIFEMRLYTGDVVLGGIPLGAVGPMGVAVDQVTGFYNGGVLTLNIVYATIDATLSLTLTTF